MPERIPPKGPHPQMGAIAIPNTFRISVILTIIGILWKNS